MRCRVQTIASGRAHGRRQERGEKEARVMHLRNTAQQSITETPLFLKSMQEALSPASAAVRSSQGAEENLAQSFRRQGSFSGCCRVAQKAVV